MVKENSEWFSTSWETITSKFNLSLYTGHAMYRDSILLGKINIQAAYQIWASKRSTLCSYELGIKLDYQYTCEECVRSGAGTDNQLDNIFRNRKKQNCTGKKVALLSKE